MEKGVKVIRRKMEFVDTFRDEIIEPMNRINSVLEVGVFNFWIQSTLGKIG